MSPQRRFLWGVIALISLIFTGAMGYMLIEKWTFSDSIFMTIITLSTVGYKEVHELSEAGRVFTSFLIVGGVGVMFYAATAIVEYFVEQGVEGIFWRRRMRNQISKLKGHFIICGYGRVGREVAAAFAKNKIPFVVIDPNEMAFAEAKEDGHLCLLGSASSDELLKEAGVTRARGLIAATGSDAENIFITLSARELNPKLFIVARTCTEDSVPKLERAGANRVVSPLALGGRRMVMLALRPLVVDFIDTVFGKATSPLELEDIEITADSPLAGKRVEEGEELTGLTILALRKKEGDLLPKPDATTIIEPGDELVVIGARKQLEKLEEAK